MRQELKDLYDLLLEQKEVQRQLLDLSHEKQQVIIKGDTERLSAITGLEQRGVIKLRKFDRKRGEMLPALCALLDIPEGEINLNAILEKLSGQEYCEFSLLQKELTGLLKAQTELNKYNTELLETHLEYTNNMLTLYVGDEDPLNNFYGGDGKAEFEKRKSAGFYNTQV